MSNRNRWASGCENSQIIAEAKVTEAVVRCLRDQIAHPEQLMAFVEAFAERVREVEAAGERPRQSVEKEIEQQEALVGKVEQALISASGSRSLAARLLSEERKLEELRAEIKAAPEREVVLPQVAEVTQHLAQLVTTLEGGGIPEGRETLRRRLRPFEMRPEPDGFYRLDGALDLLGLSATDKLSSGGVI